MLFFGTFCQMERILQLPQLSLLFLHSFITTHHHPSNRLFVLGHIRCNQ
ncbi:MAG: hypothetical protein Q8P67_23845 [archaeon]|nr:hypothetical protein [archaeon]